MICFQMMFATDMVSLCYRHCFQSSLLFELHILQGVEECQDMTDWAVNGFNPSET
jgi:hypothetical protein